MTGLTRARGARVVELPVLGVPTRFESESAAVLDAVERSFGAWRGAEPDDAEGAESLSVRVHVVGEDVAGGAGERATAVRHIAPDARGLIVRSSGCTGVAEPARRSAAAYVTARLVEDDELFRSAVLEALTLALISGLERHPLHAAAVAREGHALLLTGPSGAGKSTLAYAAHAAGLDVMSEDRVWVQLVPRLRVWGWPGEIRLAERAAALVGAAGALRPSTRDGKTKLAVTLERSRAACHVVDRATVCVLDATRGARPRAVRLDRDAVIDALTRDVPPGFDRYPERHARVAAALAASGGWRLTLSTDACEAIELMREMVEARS